MLKRTRGIIKPVPLLVVIAAIGCALLVIGTQKVIEAQSVSDFIDNMLGLEDDPFEAEAIVNPPFVSISYGVQAFLWWDDGVTTPVQMDWVRLMSFTYVKQTFAWLDIEPTDDEWHFGNSDHLLDELDRRNLRLVARLSDAPVWVHPGATGQVEAGYVDAPPDSPHLDDWGEFCGTLAERYRGRIAAYQVWNEPNLAREWGGNTPDATAYVELLRVCSQAIRAADPQAIIISAGLAPTGRNDDVVKRDDMYLQDMYTADFQQYIDVVGVHAPGFTAPEYGPDDAERDGRGRWATFRRVEDLRKIMIRNGDAARQMAILEMGYTTDQQNPAYSWFAVTQDEQADMLVRAFDYIAEYWRPWVGLVTVIYIPKPTWTPNDEEYWWSITDPAMLSIRPAFRALATMPKYCGDIIIPARTAEESAYALADNPCD